MSAPRSRRWLVLLLAATFALAAGAVPALAGGPYSLHVKISRGEKGQVLDLSLPWDLLRGTSPFDFASWGQGGSEVAPLRAAWTELGHLPEGRSVIMTAEHGRVRAWRRAGALVLEPLDDPQDRDARIRVPGEIVEAILRRDGRLRSDDVNSLLQRRGEVALVEVTSADAHIEVWIDRRAGGDSD